MKLDPKMTRMVAGAVLIVAAGFTAIQIYKLNANLSASAAITQKLSAELEILKTDKQALQEQAKARDAEVAKLNQDLESLREKDTATGRKNEELEKLVTDSEKTLSLQNAKMEELQARLKDTDERLKRLREKSEGLAGAARDAKSGAGSNAEYAKLMESQWLATLAQTEKLQKELEEAMLALADGNATKNRMQKEVATMHYNLAVILTGQGKFEAAVREYERVLQIRPEDPDAHYNLAVLYDTELKNRDKALQHYRRYVEVAPDRPDTPKVKLWIKDKEFQGRLNHPSFLPSEEKRF